MDFLITSRQKIGLEAICWWSCGSKCTESIEVEDLWWFLITYSRLFDGLFGRVKKQYLVFAWRVHALPKIADTQIYIFTLYAVTAARILRCLTQDLTCCSAAAKVCGGRWQDAIHLLEAFCCIMEFKGHLLEYEYCGKGWLLYISSLYYLKWLNHQHMKNMNFEWKMVKGDFETWDVWRTWNWWNESCDEVGMG